MLLSRYGHRLTNSVRSDEYLDTHPSTTNSMSLYSTEVSDEEWDMYISQASHIITPEKSMLIQESYPWYPGIYLHFFQSDIIDIQLNGWKFHEVLSSEDNHPDILDGIRYLSHPLFGRSQKFLFIFNDDLTEFEQLDHDDFLQISELSES